MALHFEFTPSKTIAWLFHLCGIEESKNAAITLNNSCTYLEPFSFTIQQRTFSTIISWSRCTSHFPRTHSTGGKLNDAFSLKGKPSSRSKERTENYENKWTWSCKRDIVCVWRKLVVNYMHAPSWNAGYLIILLWGKRWKKLMVEQLKRKPNERMNGKTRVKVIANMIQNKIPHKCHAQCTVHTLKHNGIIAHKLFMNHDQCSNALPTITCTIIVLIVLYLCQFPFCIPFIPPSNFFLFSR